MARKRTHFKISKVPYDNRRPGEILSTWDAYALNLYRNNDRELYEFTNRNKTKLRSMNKNDAIRLMLRHSNISERINPNFISKTALDYIIASHR